MRTELNSVQDFSEHNLPAVLATVGALKDNQDHSESCTPSRNVSPEDINIWSNSRVPVLQKGEGTAHFLCNIAHSETTQLKHNIIANKLQKIQIGPTTLNFT